MANLTTLPLFTDSSYSYVTSLNGVQYTLAFYINTRLNQLHMDVKDASNNYIYTGVAIVPLLKMVNYKASPLGGYFYLLPLSTSTVYSQIDPHNVGQYYQLMFIPN